MSIKHNRGPRNPRGRNRKRRPKTFKSKEAAEKWAKEQGLKDYTVEQLRFGLSNKYRVSVQSE